MGLRAWFRATGWLPVAIVVAFNTGCDANEPTAEDRGFAGASAGTGVLAGMGGSSGTAGMSALMTGGVGASGSGGAAGDAMITGGIGGAGSVGGSGGAGGIGGSAGTGGLPNEPTCFEFRNHGQPVAGDTTKYPVGPGEQYVCNHFTIPWNEDVEMVSYQTLYDNQQVLHHWLLYSVPGGAVDGSFEPCIGTHLLQDAQLVAGWAVGSNDVDMPADVGLRMPGPDRSFLLEWHFYNSGLEEQQDGSGVRVCVVPKGVRAKTAGMTWLGTEDFNGPAGMPPGVQSEFSGTCVNDSSGPITIFRIWPHMHKWGRNMKSTVARVGSVTEEEAFNRPFDFNYQVSYEANVVLMPGDSITSTCTFNNESSGSVAFGPSSDQEMCYQFAFSYPAGELDNGVLSLVGATNTCW